MSKTHIPTELPLNAIRVFVEAARRLSFSRAAAALGMTPSGVSRHVATVERCLGVRLFERLGATVRLTDAGRQYFDTVKDAMSTLEWATRQWARPADERVRLGVRSSLPTFVQTVLIPALPDFQAQAAVSVDLVTSLSDPQPHEVFDVLISRDLRMPQADQWLVARERLVCVCAPGRIQETSERPPAQWPFLVTRSRPDVLPAWAHPAGLDPNALSVRATFDHYFLALAAAAAGLGCLVVPQVLAQPHLDQGWLVRAAGVPGVEGSGRYAAFVHPRSAHPAQAQTFCRWLKARLAPSD